MNLTDFLLVLTYPICAVVCASVIYAQFRSESCLSVRFDSGIAIALGLLIGLFNVPGILVTLLLTGFAEHGLKLPFTR